MTSSWASVIGEWELLILDWGLWIVDVREADMQACRLIVDCNKDR